MTLLWPLVGREERRNHANRYANGINWLYTKSILSNVWPVYVYVLVPAIRFDISQLKTTESFKNFNLKRSIFFSMHEIESITKFIEMKKFGALWYYKQPYPTAMYKSDALNVKQRGIV